MNPKETPRQKFNLVGKLPNLVLAGALVFSGAGCLDTDKKQTPTKIAENVDQMTEFESKVLPFKMKLAPGWTTEDREIYADPSSGSQIEIVGEEANIGIELRYESSPQREADKILKAIEQRSRLVDQLPPPQSPSELINRSKFKVIEIGETKVDNQKAIIITTLNIVPNIDPNKTGDMEEHTKFKQIMFQHKNTGNTFILTFLSSPEDFEEQVSEFDKMLSTFQAR